MKKEKKTFVVVGVPRGGTSMVGGLLRLFGIFMGDKINGAYGDKHEDKEFYASKRKHQRDEIIKRRNKAHDIWGFKDPSIAPYLPDMTELRNPHFIIIFRDVYACGLSASSRNSNKELINSIKRAQDWLQHIIRFYFEHIDDFKFHLISYEKMLLNKEQEIRKLAIFCGTPVKDLDVDIKHLIKFVSPGYKSLKDERGDWTNCFHENYFDSNKKGLEELKSTIRPARAWEDPDADAESHIKMLGIDDSIGSVLEIGCGIGRMIRVLEKKYNKISYGIDASEKMILHSKDYLTGTGAVTRQCQPNGHFRMNEVPLFNKKMPFDCIFSIITFQHIPSINVVKKYIKSSHEHLLDGGKLVFQVLDEGFVREDAALMHYHNPDSLIKYMGDIGFKDIKKELKNKVWVFITGKK